MQTHQTMDDTACLRKWKSSIAREIWTDGSSCFAAKYIIAFPSNFPTVLYFKQHRRLSPTKSKFAWCGESPWVLRDTARQCVAIALPNKRDSTVPCSIAVSAMLVMLHSGPHIGVQRYDFIDFAHTSPMRYYTEMHCCALLICSFHKQFRAFHHFSSESTYPEKTHE